MVGRARGAELLDVRHTMARVIALLRGVNLVKRNRVAMPELRELLGELGYGDVRTVVASGNVVADTAKSAAAVADELEAAIADRFGVTTRVIVRTRAQLAKVVAADPFADVVDEPKRYQVAFLDAKPKAAGVRALEAADLAPERVAVVGREVYCWHANGIHASPLAKLLGKTDLGAAATARNWNTVLKLHELAER
jgi:uncharacterized protein (DUF1697 family)